MVEAETWKPAGQRCHSREVLGEVSTSIHGPPARLATLTEISRVVSATLDLHVLYDTIYEQVGRLMDTGHFLIALHHPDRNSVELTYLREMGKLFKPEEYPYGDNVTSWVIQRGTPLLLDDDRAYREFVHSNGLPEILVGTDESEAKIWVPLSTGNRTIGAVSVQSARSHAYTPDDVQTLSVIASQAAVAIENASLYQRSQDSVGQMQALLSVGQMLNSSLDLATVLDEILAGIRQVLPYYFAAILLPDATGRYLRVAGIIAPESRQRPVEGLRQEIRVPIGEGVTGRVFDSGEPLMIADVRLFAAYLHHEAADVLSEMAVPLKRGDSVVGVLDIERQEAGSFSPEDLRLLVLFASQAAIAIENARLFSEQQNRVYELQSIQSIVQQVTPLHDSVSIAKLISEELKKLIDYHSCRIFSLHEQSQELVPIVAEDDYPTDHRIPVGKGITGWIAASGESAMVQDSLADPRVVEMGDLPEVEESVVGVPLYHQDSVQGVITLSKFGRDQFDEHALRLLEIVAGQAAIAFDRVGLYDELRSEAVTDDLTKLYNRRCFSERLREEGARANRRNRSLAAVMLDIDKFKWVNDAHGHDAGDAVLRDLATVIRLAVRTEDIVARWGGEEFCVLLPETSRREAARVAERIRALVAAHKMPPEAGVRHVTVSVGLSMLRVDDQAADLLSRADAAMYEGKRLGGNQVCVAGGNNRHKTEAGSRYSCNDHA